LNSVTIKDIAKESGVSTATVSRVLNNSGYASNEIKERVLSVVKELNYQPNAVARSLKMQHTKTIGVIVPDISNTYFMKISKGIEDTIHKSGYNLIFASGDENPGKEYEMLQVLYEKRIDALVLATSGENEEMIKNIKDSGVPIILVDRKIKDEALELDVVVEDNIEGAYQLTNHLIQQGHTRIGVVNGSLTVSTGMERYLGYKKALRENNISEEEELIFNGSFIEEDGVEAVEYFISKRDMPTAIISFNNTMTFGVLLHLTRKGYNIPKDVVVASYGEVEAAQLLKSSGLISIYQSPYEMGVRVGEILLERLLNKVDGPIQEKFIPIFNISN
jgi:LacI family transcriptional regulator